MLYVNNSETVFQEKNSDKIFIVGYSFGAVVAMMLGTKNVNIRAFVLISTPFGRST